MHHFFFFCHRPQKRSQIRLLVFLVCAAVILAAAAPSANAQTAASTDYFMKISKTIITPAVAIVAAFLWIIEKFLTFLLGLMADAMDNLLMWNVQFAPASWVAVQIGWSALRDVANSLFILIVLWIAFTIIFNLEELGGKKLLIRVIVVALLINFSLAFVATTFGVANIFAQQFYNLFPTTTVTLSSGQQQTVPAVAQFIKDSIQLDTVFTPLTPEAAKEMAEAQAQAGEQAMQQMRDSGGPSRFAYAEALGFPKAEAAFFIPILIFLGKAAATLAISWAVGAGISIVVGDVFSTALRLATVDLLLLIVVASFAIITVMLIVRMVAMAFLSVVAPAAFFSLAVPGGASRVVWKQWIDALLRWAFFAPAFFFLFYIALLILGEGYKQLALSKAQYTNAAASSQHFIAILMAVGFLIASVLLARKIAGRSADMALGVAKTAGTFALGAVTGGAGVAAAALARAPAVAGAAQTAIQGINRVPLLRTIASPVTRGVTAYISRQQQKVKEAEEGASHLTPAARASEFAVRMAAGKVGIAQSLKKDRELGLLSESQIRQSVSLAGQFSKKMQEDLLKARPDLVIPENIRGADLESTAAGDIIADFVEKMRAEDIDNIDWANIGRGRSDDEQRTLRDQLMAQLFRTGSPDRLQKISSALMHQRREVRADFEESLRRVIESPISWGGVKAADPMMHDRYVRYIYSRAGKNVLPFAAPDFLKPEARRLGVKAP